MITVYLDNVPMAGTTEKCLVLNTGDTLKAYHRLFVSRMAAGPMSVSGNPVWSVAFDGVRFAGETPSGWFVKIDQEHFFTDNQGRAIPLESRIPIKPPSWPTARSA